LIHIWPIVVWNFICIVFNHVKLDFRLDVERISVSLNIVLFAKGTIFFFLLLIDLVNFIFNTSVKVMKLWLNRSTPYKSLNMNLKVNFYLCDRNYCWCPHASLVSYCFLLPWFKCFKLSINASLNLIFLEIFNTLNDHLNPYLSVFLYFQCDNLCLDYNLWISLIILY
jgi:hypothetical protein